RYEIQPPCIFFMSPGQAHKLELSTDVNGYIFLFTSEFYHFNQKNKNRLLEFPFFFSVDQQNPPIYLNNEKDNNFLRELFERGCQKMTSSTKDKEILHRALLDVLLISCDELYPHELQSVQKGKGIILVKNFLLLIEENYQKNLRVNDYADMLAVTPNHLTQMVRQVTSKTSVELLQERIIAEAKRLLIHTNMNVTEIAESMNFPDQSYFSKYFKKSTGLSPNQYRMQNV
ncbi:MAG: helix-turn-helix transcriptional regulator, partial [Bacteroidales bacterium]|nr:helix-turn-helix transcriptional regulator [Bacteroidales bacterium]